MLLFMHSSPLPHHLISLSPKYLLQHSVLKHPQPMFLPHCERPSFTLVEYNRKNYSSVHFKLCICR